MNRRHNAFKTTKVKLTDFPKEVRDKFEQLFTNLEAAKADTVRAERDAEIATGIAAVKKSSTRNAELKILLEASEFDKRIECERHWTVFRDHEGNIVFEGITERILRNATRAGLQQMGRQVEDQEQELNLEMFDDEPNEEDEGKK